MFVKAIIFIFLILFLILTPLTAQEEPLDIDVEFPNFYEVNISGEKGKIIGVAGVCYPLCFNVSPSCKEVNLTKLYLNISFTYNGEFYNQSIYSYGNNCNYLETKELEILCDTFNLKKELDNGKRSCFCRSIVFFEPGTYITEWREIVGHEEMETGKLRRISIVEPYEYENLIKQAQLIDAEKRSAETSEETANATKLLAKITSFLVFATLITAFTIFYLEGRRKKLSLIKALYAEIEHNHLAAQKMIEIRRTQTVFTLTPLDTLSYQNIRMTGEVLNLRAEDMRNELDELYELINAHNRQLPAVYEIIPRDQGFYERLETISEKAKHLKNELPKIFKFLAPNRD